MSALDQHQRRMWRAALTSDTLLDLDELAEALPGRPEDTRPWALRHVPSVGTIAGVMVYRWGDAVASVEVAPGSAVRIDPAAWFTTAQAAQHLGVARSTLDAMVSRAPPDLPGAPVLVGTGRRRRRWKWSAETLDEWHAAYSAWDANRPAKPSTRTLSRHAPPTGSLGETPVDWHVAGRSR